MLIVECVIRECIRIQIDFIFRDPRSIRLVKNNCSNLTSSCLFKKNTILLSVLFLSLLLFKITLAVSSRLRNQFKPYLTTEYYEIKRSSKREKNKK